MKKAKGLAKVNRNGRRAEQHQNARSLVLFERGVKTAGGMAAAMSLLMADVMSGRTSSQRASATCNAAGKMLKVIEMEQKYGTALPHGPKLLRLVPSEEA